MNYENHFFHIIIYFNLKLPIWEWHRKHWATGPTFLHLFSKGNSLTEKIWRASWCSCSKNHRRAQYHIDFSLSPSHDPLQFYCLSHRAPGKTLAVKNSIADLIFTKNAAITKINPKDWHLKGGGERRNMTSKSPIDADLTCAQISAWIQQSSGPHPGVVTYRFYWNPRKKVDKKND